MVTRKCVICKGKSHAYWPSSAHLKNKWTKLIEENFPQAKVNKSGGLCKKHFRPEDFTNWQAYHSKSGNGRYVTNKWVLRNIAYE
jgi:hypothetical protein